VKEQIQSIVSQLYDSFRRKDIVREELIRYNRELTRASGLAIQNFVSNNPEKAKEYLENALSYLTKIRNIIEQYREFEGWGGISSGIEEYCEAKILEAIIKEKNIPTPEELGVAEELYILGMADVPGELKRILLIKLMDDDLEYSRHLVELIRTFYTSLVGIDFSKGQISSLRKKIDRVRYVMEQAERDLATSYVSIKLRKAIEKQD